MVYASDSESNNNDNKDDSSESEDPEVANPEDSVKITVADEKESEHVRVVSREPKLEGVGSESEESVTPGVADPTGAVTFDETQTKSWMRPYMNL